MFSCLLLQTDMMDFCHRPSCCASWRHLRSFSWRLLVVPRHQLSTSELLLSRDRNCRIVCLLFYGDRRWGCVLSSDNRRSIRSTSDVSANRMNICHRPAMLWRPVFRAGYKIPYLLICILTDGTEMLAWLESFRQQQLRRHTGACGALEVLPIYAI